jgi:hypothetical protein
MEKRGKVEHIQTSKEESEMMRKKVAAALNAGIFFYMIFFCVGVMYSGTV